MNSDQREYQKVGLVARQDAWIKTGGDVTFEGEIEPFMTLIKAGEVLHVGKGTSFGLGKYEVGG